MVKLPAIFSRLLKRAHPDVYEAVKSYAEARGVDVSDVIASAIASYLSADEQGKEELEKAMAERRLRGGGTDIKAAINVLKEMLNVYTELSKAFSEARASFQISQIISDYKAISEAAREISQIGQSKGSGSLEDVFAQAFIGRILSGLGAQQYSRQTQKTGASRVEKIEE